MDPPLIVKSIDKISKVSLWTLLNVNMNIYKNKALNLILKEDSSLFG